MPVPSPSPLFVVPFPHNSGFVGREAELAQLYAALGGASDLVGVTPAGVAWIGRSTSSVESF